MRRYTTLLSSVFALLALVALIAFVTTPDARAQSAVGRTFTLGINGTTSTAANGVAVLATATNTRYKLVALTVSSATAGVLEIKSGNVADTARACIYLAQNTPYTLDAAALGRSGITFDRGEAIVFQIGGDVTATMVYTKD